MFLWKKNKYFNGITNLLNNIMKFFFIFKIQINLCATFCIIIFFFFINPKSRY